MAKKQYDPNQSLKSQLLDVGADALDDLVHEEASKLASATNNDGLSAQIDFLTEQRGYTDECIFNAIFNEEE